MKIGDKVRTTYQHSWTGTIVRPRKSETPPSAEWFIVRDDERGGKVCIHQSMLVIRND